MPLPTPLDMLKEGVIVGVILTIIYFVVHSIAMSMYKEKSMTDHTYLGIQVFLSGLLFHVIFEYVGWNKKFCEFRQYEK